MTKDELIFKIETQQPFEFQYNGNKYNMMYDKADDGSVIIRFELMNTARIENHFFKDMLDIV